MFHGRWINNRTICLHERALRMIYDINSSFVSLLEGRVLCSWFHSPVFGVRNSILNWVSKTQFLREKRKEKGI